MQQQEKDLFRGYEIKSWDYSPYLYKIFAAAAVFNILALLVLGQADVLTARGCDSPFVGRVCQVIDTIYIGSTFVGKDSGFIDGKFIDTKIQDAEITYIDVSAMDKPLVYPEGYFALANPYDVQNTAFDYSTMQSGMSSIPGIPGFPTNPSVTDPNDLLTKPQVVPPVNKNAVQGPIPTSPFMTSENPIAVNPTIRNRKFPRNIGGKSLKNNSLKNDSPDKLPTFPDETVAGNKIKPEVNESETKPPLESEAVTDFRPNKQPLEKFAADILAKRTEENNKLDLSKSFLVQMTGELDKDGKLITKKSAYVKSEGDEEMVNLAKSAIEAINNSGMFYYLKSQGVDKLDFTLVQDDKQMYAVISSSQKSEERARTLSSGFNGLLLLAKTLVKEQELKTLIESSKVEPKGKNFVFNFAMPKADVQKMINLKLQEAEAKKKEADKNNQTINAVQGNINQKAGK